MIVQQAKDIVRQWIVEEVSQTTGFHGAFFHGSINWLTDDALLPPTSDVDVMIVLDGSVPPQKLGKILYHGVIIEATYLPVEQVLTAEQVLGLSHLAGSLHTNSIIADPTGQLHAIQVKVSNGYTKRTWVAKRCEHAEHKVKRNLQAVDEAQPFHDQVLAWLFGTGVTTHILLAAGLKNLTVRKRYTAVRELLEKYGRADFYEPLLDLLGCAQITPSQVNRHVDRLADVFDAAQAVIRSPFSFASDISDLARPVAIDGSRELIENGDHREAVFWIAVTYSRCQKVLAEDGPPEMFDRYAPGYRALLADLGIHTFADLRQRSQQVLEMLPRIWDVAEAIMAANPQIVD